MTNPLPPADLLRKAFRYEPDTGKLYWRFRDNVSQSTNTRFAGREAGNGQEGSGLRVRFNNQLIAVHRIIYVIMEGDCLYPEDEIDHKDLDTLNNRWSNLRKANSSQNKGNREAQSNNYTTGFKSIDIVNGRFRTRIQGRHVGVFDTIEEALLAYDKVAEQVFGDHRRVSLLQL